MFGKRCIDAFYFCKKVNVKRIWGEFPVAPEYIGRNNGRNNVLLRKIVGPHKNEDIFVVKLKAQVKPSGIVHLIIDHGLPVAEEFNDRSSNISLLSGYPPSYI